VKSEVRLTILLGGALGAAHMSAAANMCAAPKEIVTFCHYILSSFIIRPRPSPPPTQRANEAPKPVAHFPQKPALFQEGNDETLDAQTKPHPLPVALNNHYASQDVLFRDSIAFMVDIISLNQEGIATLPNHPVDNELPGCWMNKGHHIAHPG
jgi:hypothetical protein